MLGIFGYMCFLIVYKWCIDWRTPPETLQGNAAPSILNIMIQMFLSPRLGTFDPKYHLYPGQPGIQMILILAAVASVPIMLFVKPFTLKKQHEAAKKSGFVGLLDDGPKETDAGHGGEHGGGHGGHGHGEEFEFTEVMVHQCIHTIEFVLGAISNTASYLRLWALRFDLLISISCVNSALLTHSLYSLAHAELSKVFWEMILLTGLSFTDMGGFGQAIMLFICFAIWTGLTVAVLLLMESLSAFLHALRLHWVEFQNKFYQGDGYSFQPFSYQVIIAQSAAVAADAAAHESG